MMASSPTGWRIPATTSPRNSSRWLRSGERCALPIWVFPIGRLDMDSRGLLLLTDDGELANRLAHPRYHVAKEYLALVDGVPGENDLRKLREGVLLEDRRTAPAEGEIAGSARGRTQARLTI